MSFSKIDDFLREHGINVRDAEFAACCVFVYGLNEKIDSETMKAATDRIKMHYRENQGMWWGTLGVMVSIVGLADSLNDNNLKLKYFKQLKRAMNMKDPQEKENRLAEIVDELKSLQDRQMIHGVAKGMLALAFAGISRFAPINRVPRLLFAGASVITGMDAMINFYNYADIGYVLKELERTEQIAS